AMPVAIGCKRMLMSPFVMAGRYLAVVMWTGAEVVAAPRLSLATAVSVCTPGARVALRLYGRVESLPNNTRPSKNRTFVTLPSLSWALAVIGTLAGAVKEAPLVGESTETEGGILAAAGVDRSYEKPLPPPAMPPPSSVNLTER